MVVVPLTSYVVDGQTKWALASNRKPVNMGGKSSDFQRHMITHTGEMLFKCNQCSKAYKHKQKLTKHSQLHMTSD